MSNLVLTHSTKSESFYHKAIKRLMFKYISENSKNIVEKSLEKFIGNRRADVYFRMKSGKQIVVEIQNSNITVKEIISRTEHYTKNGIHVLWLLYGQGTCVASPKFPEDKKNIKISMVENFLHGMYGGRVYYVNINFHEDKTTISVPFALHFSLSSIKKYRKVFRSKFESYYIKNVNFSIIPSWSLLCVDFNDFKLARFYDKNIKRVLKAKIIKHYHQKLSRFKSKKKLLKSIENYFKNKYGSYLILLGILELINEQKIDFNHKNKQKIHKKVLLYH